MVTTHFVPYDARRNGRWSEATCGAWVRDYEQSPTPTCSTCAAEVTAQDADTRTVDEVFGAPPSVDRDRR